MKPLALAALLLWGSAHAEGTTLLPSWARPELGIGTSLATGQHDGIWVQEGLPHSQHLYAPTYTLGLTGDLYTHSSWSLAYHLDYFYSGTTSVGSWAVPDAAYNVATKTAQAGAPQTYFYGSGHTQGVALTLSPTWSYGKIRLAVEAGPMVYWSSWHETVYTSPTPITANHRTTTQLTYLVGASVAYGDMSLSYRYYNRSQQWNPYPQYTSGAHMLSFVYRF